MVDFETWSSSELVSQLNTGGFAGDISSCFLKHEIEGAVLPLLLDEHLKEIGVTNVGQRLQLMKWIRKVTKNSSIQKPNMSSVAPPKQINDVYDNYDNYENSPPSKAAPSSKAPAAAKQMRSSTGSMGSASPGNSPNQSPTQTKPAISTGKRPQTTSGTRSSTGSSGSSNASAATGESVPKCKRDHDKMVEQIRAARKYMAYEKAREEGRAVGPPPDLPPIEEPPDLVQCPNCGRKFGAEAAKRHIPVCERMNVKKTPPPRRK